MEPRYKLEELIDNKIVGVKLPGQKKVIWGVMHHHKIYLTKSIDMVYLYDTAYHEPSENVSINTFFIEECGEFSYTYDTTTAIGYLSCYPIIPLSCIVSVDITKAHIPPRIQEMSTFELLELVHISRATGFVKIQDVIHAKAELLKRDDVTKHMKKNASLTYWY